MAPGFDSAPSENEYQENFLGAKAAGAWGWQRDYLHVPNIMEVWEPKPPGALWATPGLLRDSFTFYLYICDSHWHSSQYRYASFNFSARCMKQDTVPSVYSWPSTVSIASWAMQGFRIYTFRSGPWRQFPEHQTPTILPAACISYIIFVSVIILKDV